MRNTLLVLVTLVGAGCPGRVFTSSDGDWPTGSNVGVPVDGFPSYQERLSLVAINRGRADPNNVAAGTASACSTPKAAQKPLSWSLDGSRAARFHCGNLMLNQAGLSHNSFCTLQADIGRSGCAGEAHCACVAGTEAFNCDTLGGHGTDPFTRCGYFGYASNGEVGAAGYFDGWSAVQGWITECPAAEGHRNILTRGDADQVGLGFAQGSGCWSSYSFGETGVGGEPVAVLPAGAHRPEQGTGPVEFTVNYYQPGADPQQVDVVVDGKCTPMNRELGVQAGNATYTATLEVGDGCHQYWFLAQDAAGQFHHYPDRGAYGVGTCTAWVPLHTPGDCGP